jgi:DNA-binding CsgD family transcriptional regulator
VVTRSLIFERFAGRDEELRFLVDLRARSRRDVRGATVALVGEAGVGKSRLLTEFQMAVRKGEGGGFVRVRCEELAVAYAPLIGALRALQQLHPLRTSASIARALQLMTVADSDESLDAVERKRSILDSLVEAIGGAAKRLGQLTLVVDDVHWSDLSSLEAMRALARDIETVPLLLVLSYRMEDLAADSARAFAFAQIEREGVDRIVLQPLSADDVGSLLRELVPGVSGAVVNRVCELSEGKPYVAEELVRSIVERGPDADFAAPLSLRSAVLERVARLAPAHREIIDRAAVLGRNFSPGDLQALGTSNAHLAAALRDAFDLQLLEEKEIDGQPWFRFRHALTRDILYRNLLGFEREALHLQIADHLERAGNRLAELAYHRSAARDLPRAVSANEGAGDQAAGVAAFADAVKFYARALDFASDIDTVARLARKRAESADRCGDLETLAQAVPSDAERLVAGGRVDEALAVLIVAIRPLGMSRPLDARALLDRANHLLTPQTSAAQRFSLELQNAHILRSELRNEEALAACLRAEPLAVTPYDRRAVFLSKAYCYIRLLDLESAQRELERRMREPAPDDPTEEAHTLAGMVNIAGRRGQLREGFRLSLEAASRWRLAKRERAAFFQYCNAAIFAADLGDFAFVNEVLERSRRERREGNQGLIAARVRTARAIGGDPAPLLEMWEQQVAVGNLYLTISIAQDLPFMLPDREQARMVAVRAMEAIPAESFEGEMMEAIFEFGNQGDIAKGLALHDSVQRDESDIWLAILAAQVRARFAKWDHRPLEMAIQARKIIELATQMDHWLFLYTGQELAGDAEAARATLVRVGAKAELERFDRRVRRVATPVLNLSSLTRREEQIARLIAGGMRTRDVAGRLAIGPRTVETHLANLYAKLGISTRLELADLMTQSDAESSPA